MELDYHRATFKLLQCQPLLSKRAQKKMTALEKAIGFSLPESVVEWYSLEGAVEWLQLTDSLLSFDPFDIDQNAKILKKSNRSTTKWVVGVYDSGVGYAIFLPSKSDPLVQCIETDGFLVDNGDEWSARSFSGFVFTCCWYNIASSKQSIAGTTKSFSPGSFDKLIELFDEGPRVMRGDVPPTFRNSFTGEQLVSNRFYFFFFCPSGMLHLVSADDPTSSETEVKWTLYSNEGHTLQNLASQLQSRGILV